MAIDFYHAGMNAYQTGDYMEAFEWLVQCKDEGHCAYSLGVMYYNGQGVTRDHRQSTLYYSKAAEVGILPAQVSAGFAYANAMGVPEDFEKAAYFLKMAVAQDDEAAKITLAEIYAKGEAGGDRKDAARLLREVLAVSMPEEATDVYNRYELYKVKL